MASGVEELLDMLFEMVDEAKNMPLSSDKCVLERDRALDLIDDIRAQFPVELGEAKKLVASRNDYIAAAKREAEVIRKQAEAEAQRMLAEESVLNQAKQRSAELMRQADEYKMAGVMLKNHLDPTPARAHLVNSMATRQRPTAPPL